MHVNPPDRNLLIGLLAQQNGIISRDQLVIAFKAWAQNKSEPLESILFRQGIIDEQKRQLLIALTTALLAQHENDPQRALAALSTFDETRKALSVISEAELQDNLQNLASLLTKFQDPHSAPFMADQSSVESNGRFRLLRFHKRGGLGEVFVAEDTELHREVALKGIQSQFAGDKLSRERFIREAEVTGSLEHPAIVPIYGLGSYADGRPFYAMKFIRGDSLKDAISAYHRRDGTSREKTLELRQLLQRFIDICEAIQYAHDRGVLHRDLKPGNIMLGRYGETLVVDWGLAKPLGRNESDSPEDVYIPSSGESGQTLPGRAVGTPSYMSPEQASGKLDQLAPASDTYSLGATLYHILTGEPPFVGTIDDVLPRVIAGTFKRPREIKPEVSIALEAICLKAMELSAADRYSSTKAMAADIEYWLADEPVTAVREGMLGRTLRKMRRYPEISFFLLVVGISNLICLPVWISGSPIPLVSQLAGFLLDMNLITLVITGMGGFLGSALAFSELSKVRALTISGLFGGAMTGITVALMYGSVRLITDGIPHSVYATTIDNNSSGMQAFKMSQELEQMRGRINDYLRGQIAEGHQIDVNALRSDQEKLEELEKQLFGTSHSVGSRLGPAILQSLMFSVSSGCGFASIFALRAARHHGKWISAYFHGASAGMSIGLGCGLLLTAINECINSIR